MGTEVKTCMQCGEVISGRTDKKFCSDQCRARAANRKKLLDHGERLIYHINLALRKNRFILHRACPDSKSALHREVLLQTGFDFGHYTHQYRTRQGDTFNFCYDYGYLLLPDEQVLVVNWQPFMDRG